MAYVSLGCWQKIKQCEEGKRRGKQDGGTNCSATSEMKSFFKPLLKRCVSQLIRCNGLAGDSFCGRISLHRTSSDSSIVQHACSSTWVQLQTATVNHIGTEFVFGLFFVQRNKDLQDSIGGNRPIYTLRFPSGYHVKQCNRNGPMDHYESAAFT